MHCLNKGSGNTDPIQIISYFQQEKMGNCNAGWDYPYIAPVDSFIFSPGSNILNIAIYSQATQHTMRYFYPFAFRW
jgi:hypothetical protein